MRLHHLQESFGPATFVSVEGHGPSQTLHRDPKPEPLKASPVGLDCVTWTPAEHRAAAAAVGDAAVNVLSVVRDCRHHTDALNDEAVRIAAHLASDAWRYALLALEAEDLALQTLNQAVR